MEREEIEVIDCGIDLEIAGPLGGCCFAALAPFRIG